MPEPSKVPKGNRRILMLVTDAFGGNGGIATYNRDAARALCEDRGVAEVVLVPRSISRPIQPLPPKLTHDTSGTGGIAAFAQAVLRHLRNGNFDLVYCGHVNLSPLALVAAQIARAPWLLAIYGVEAWQPSPRRLVRWAVKRANRVISISQVTMQKFSTFAPYPAARLALTPNAVHLEQYGARERNEQLARRLGLEGKTVLLTLGRMHPTEGYKGFDELIELMPSLLAEIPNLVYVAAGDGDDRSRLSAKAAQLGVGENVIFPGFVDENEKADLYRLADAYVMPSFGEGFGFVFLEAMACGTPVVASALDGGREAVLDGKLGRLVDPHDPEAIRQATLAALAEPRQLPAGLEYFSFAGFATRMQAVVGETIAAGTRP